MKSLGITPEDGADSPMPLNTTYEANARTVAGVSFDRVTQQVRRSTPQNAGPNPATFIYGPDGPVSYLGTVDGKLLTFIGPQRPADRERHCRGQGRQRPAGQGPRREDGQPSSSPARRSAVFYFQADELLRSGLNIGRQMGFNVPVQLPDDLPPVGVVVGPAENSLAIDGFISRDLMQAMVVAGLQIQQQVQGGGPGGGL